MDARAEAAHLYKKMEGLEKTLSAESTEEWNEGMILRRIGVERKRGKHASRAIVVAAGGGEITQGEGL